MRKKSSVPRYMLYSAHDLEVAGLWELFRPINYQYHSIPYASNFKMSLWYDSNCPTYHQNQNQLKNKCLQLSMSANGVQLAFTNKTAEENSTHIVDTSRNYIPYEEGHEFLVRMSYDNDGYSRKAIDHNCLSNLSEPIN